LVHRHYHNVHTKDDITTQRYHGSSLPLNDIGTPTLPQRPYQGRHYHTTLPWIVITTQRHYYTDITTTSIPRTSSPHNVTMDRHYHSTTLVHRHYHNVHTKDDVTTQRYHGSSLPLNDIGTKSLPHNVTMDRPYQGRHCHNITTRTLTQRLYHNHITKDVTTTTTVPQRPTCRSREQPADPGNNL
jgi:hypothetical protein